jgi:hypothetical protein
LAPAAGFERRRGKRAPRRPHGGRGRLARRNSTSAGPAAIPDPQEGSFSPAGSSPPARPASGGPRWPPPPRFSGFLATTLEEALEVAEAGAASARPAPFAAARAFALARRALTSGGGRPSLGDRGGEGELLAAWLADAVLAQRLNWPFALPLLAASLFLGAGRRAGVLENPADGGETTRVVFAYAKAAAGAIDLSCDLARWAEKLTEAAQKLRAKGAGAALRALLDEDCLAASSEFGGQLSERGARRLFDRLVALGAIRELTGRATFRLYGL